MLQAIARVNRPYDEIKKHGIIRDFWGVFSHLNEALRYDKAEFGEAAFPLQRVREEFKLQMETILDLLKGFERCASHGAMVRVLTFFNRNEPSRDKFDSVYNQICTNSAQMRLDYLKHSLSPSSVGDPFGPYGILGQIGAGWHGRSVESARQPAGPRSREQASKVQFSK